MRRLRSIAAIGVVAALALATVGAGAASGAAQGGGQDLYVIGVYETTGESAQAIPNFEDAAQMAIKDLEKEGWTVQYERIPASAVSAASQEESFLQVQNRNPDAWIGLTSSNVFVPVGPKVAATDIPTFALASPTEGVRNGTSGGDNIFLLRPLNEQTYAKLLDYACKEMKLKKIGLNIVNTSFGATVDDIVKRELPKYKNCEIVTTQSNGFAATDLTQQVLAFKDAGVDGIITASFPAPMGVLVNQLRQNGVTVPVLGGASLNLAKDAGSLQDLTNLVVIDDCVPELDKAKNVKKFVKAYDAEYGYAPNYASAQVYDAFHMAAEAVEKAGHDHAAINKALAATVYDGMCDYKVDKNNVLGNSVTVYEYDADGTKKLLKNYPLAYVPSDELAATTTVAPATTAAP
jgi:branched-chain amino acid transport system substrate-binding protein